MKINKILAILLGLFLVVILSLFILFNNLKRENETLRKYNQEYEFYLNKSITGLDLATIINKTVSLNENNNISKDKKGHYIENNENSIKIEIKIKLTDKTYSMEEFYNNSTSEFVKYFSEEKFTCSKISYHKKTGKVKKITFTQIEN